MGPNGQRRQLEVDNLVPYLPDSPEVPDDREDDYAMAASPMTLKQNEGISGR